VRHIVCTTGTSIARKVVPYGGVGDRARFVADIRSRCTGAKIENRATFRKEASAEINSLDRLRVTAADHVVLLSSETDDGEICAAEIARILDGEFGIAAESMQVQGLQVKDAVRFRREGVQSLFACLDKIRMNAEESDEILLNITGGFKSVVPYVTLYGMLRRQRVVYLFEGSDQLIFLPPAPLSFDWDRLSRAAGALRALRDGLMTEDAFYALVPDLRFDEREQYGCLLESADDLVAPSAFGDIVFAALDEAESAHVYLSREAREAFAASSGVAREQYAFILTRLPNPLLRQQHDHPIHGSDLRFWKPGRTKERASYYIQGQSIRVCELTAHEYTLRNREDFPVNEFTRFVLPTTERVPETEELLIEGWADRVERAEILVKHAAESASAADALVEEAARERDAARREADELRTVLRRAENEIDVKTAILGDLQRENARWKGLPWWRRILGPS